jgi:hypothetical protein
MNTGCGQLPKSPKVSVRTRHELEVRFFQFGFFGNFGISGICLISVIRVIRDKVWV